MNSAAYSKTIYRTQHFCVKALASLLVSPCKPSWGCPKNLGDDSKDPKVMIPWSEET